MGEKKGRNRSSGVTGEAEVFLDIGQERFPCGSDLNEGGNEPFEDLEEEHKGIFFRAKGMDVGEGWARSRSE